MIILFSKLCKAFKQISSENEIDTFNRYIKSINVSGLACPSCGAKHSMSIFAHYKRNLVTYDNNKVSENKVSIPRYICSSCNHTHAVLPPIIVPYAAFSFKFMVNIIYDYIKRRFNSVEAMCRHYQISISTFYRILNKFKEDKLLWLGFLKDKMISDLAFVQDIKRKTFAQTEYFMEKFLDKNGLSFLEKHHSTAINKYF